MHEDLYDEVNSGPYWHVPICPHNSPIHPLEGIFIPQKHQSLNTSSQGVGEAEEVLRLDYGQTGRPFGRWHTLRAPSQQSD